MNTFLEFGYNIFKAFRVISELIKQHENVGGEADGQGDFNRAPVVFN